MAMGPISTHYMKTLISHILKWIDSGEVHVRVQTCKGAHTAKVPYSGLLRMYPEHEVKQHLIDYIEVEHDCKVHSIVIEHWA